jgi:hypothetical protein
MFPLCVNFSHTSTFLLVTSLFWYVKKKPTCDMFINCFFFIYRSLFTCWGAVMKTWVLHHVFLFLWHNFSIWNSKVANVKIPFHFLEAQTARPSLKVTERIFAIFFFFLYCNLKTNLFMYWYVYYVLVASFI